MITREYHILVYLMLLCLVKNLSASCEDKLAESDLDRDCAILECRSLLIDEVRL